MSISEFFKKLFSKMLVINCLGIILTTIVVSVGAYFFIDFYTHHGEEVTMPDICGTNEEVAVNKLKALGLKAEVVDTGYVYNVAPYTVLEQSIKPGMKIKPGRTIALTINADGARKIAIPDLADNSSRREAEDKLRVLGFKLGKTEYVMGDPDWVYGVKVNGKSVAAGTKVSVDSPITLVVGSGGLEDEFNGNDSLDFITNPVEEEVEIIEIEVPEGYEDYYPEEIPGTTPSTSTSATPGSSAKPTSTTKPSTSTKPNTTTKPSTGTKPSNGKGA